MRRDGVVKFDIKLPGPGVVNVLETAWTSDQQASVASVVLLQAAPHRFVFARGHRAAQRAGTIQVTVAPNARGKRLVLHHRYAVRMRLWVTFDPIGGKQAKQGFLELFVTK